MKSRAALPCNIPQTLSVVLSPYGRLLVALLHLTHQNARHGGREDGPSSTDESRDPSDKPRDAQHESRDAQHESRDAQHVTRDAQHEPRDAQHVTRDALAAYYNAVCPPRCFDAHIQSWPAGGAAATVAHGCVAVRRAAAARANIEEQRAALAQ
eukprot:344361-Prymnesium_polylepis.1